MKKSCMLPMALWAQEERAWSKYLNEVMTVEDVESSQWEETYEWLCELEQHPLDINLATREQLEELPFLAAQQIEELVEYRARYGPMKSLGELLMIRSLSYGQRERSPRTDGHGAYPFLQTAGRQRRLSGLSLSPLAALPVYERRCGEGGDRRSTGCGGAFLRKPQPLGL